ncbi:MAG: methyltransferase domain-containing protein, partial [Acidobacteriota bacterium]|nr:methyltransferase domain-containing protein [Acidobacteriota bacterium]
MRGLRGWSGLLAEIEFTGERIIPGIDDVDLWNEHWSRYAFARQFAAGKSVLDAGCGTGYGSAHLALNAREVLGIDNSEEAVGYARAHFAQRNLRFEQGLCQSLPVADGSVDLIAAFEVIEHLPEWRKFLGDARRALTPGGLFLVSTPNKICYAESRREIGPNRYHVHEFEYAEFREALSEFFPHVSILAQNHGEAIAFRPLGFHSRAKADLDAVDPVVQGESAHFLIAICSPQPLPEIASFVYLPGAANLLHDREQHIAKLEEELRLKAEWLQEQVREHGELMEMFSAQKAELEERNLWARERHREAEARGRRVIDLQEELAREQKKARVAVEGYESEIARIELQRQQTVSRAVEMERRLTEELETRTGELVKCVEFLHAAEATVEERTAWA